MRLGWHALAIALAAGSHYGTASGAKASAVHNLSDKAFDAWSDAQELALVKFFAPWCGYCQAMAPSYEQAAVALKKDGIPLAEVDCTKETKLCEELDIPGYPTLKVVVNGDYVKYNGTREESGIVDYMRRHKQAPLPEIAAPSFDAFRNSANVVAVGFFGRNTAEYGVLEEVARELRDEYTFGFVSDRTLAKAQEVPAPGIAVYKDGAKADIFTGAVSSESVIRFVRATSVPVLGELSSQTFGNYIRAGVPIGLVFYSTDAMRNELATQLERVARDFKRSVSLALVDARIYSKHAMMLSLEPTWPAFAIHDVAQHTKYPLPQPRSVSEAELRPFITSFAEGRLAPYYKSEPVPAANDGNVFELVSKQFNSVAFDTSKDVLVLFHAPWCIHCKRMAEAYEALGAAMKQHTNLVVARMDGTANDVPSHDAALQVSGYPTVVLVRAIDNRVISYSGNRSLQSLTDFLQLHATHSLGASDAPQVEVVHVQSAYDVISNRDLGFSPKEARHIEL
ncbi:protein disulfide-isomerase precursor [Coemansia sp. RSA 678]|nr:protein disulfide-isomerase precursor [Coemansia sp. RSA 678]